MELLPDALRREALDTVEDEDRLLRDLYENVMRSRMVSVNAVALLKEHDFDVVGAVGDGQKLIDAARLLKPDVIVTDLSMPGLSGLDVQEALAASARDLPIVFISGHGRVPAAVRAMKAV